MPVNPVSLLGLDVVESRFRLHSTIAAGKSSKAYFGEDLVNGCQVFIKFLLFPRSSLESALFENEIYTLDHLNDIEPRVSPKLLASGKMYDGDVLYLITAKAEGKSLETYLQTKLLCLDFNSKLEVFHRIASCLTYCLASGWNHRDLHPGNILLLDEAPIFQGQEVIDSGPDPKAMLVDWGQSYPDLAAQFDDSPLFMRTLHRSYFKSFTASLYSSPPEIFRCVSYHHLNLGYYDSWALGLILYRILTGRNCFEFRSLGDYAQSVAESNLQDSISKAASEIASQGHDCSFLLSILFSRLVCIDAAKRLHAGEAARVLWDLRIEGWRPANGAEITEYLTDPQGFTPEGGWKYSSVPEIDEG